VNEYVVAPNLSAVLAGAAPTPTVVLWNRLEGRPRRPDFTRALAAEVRDPLWLLTRQWQMGEFIGEDAGSPVLAKVAWSTDTVTSVRTAAAAVPFDESLPLEAVVEARPLPLTTAGRPSSVDIRLALGRRWRKLLTAAGLSSLLPAYLGAYRFTAPDPSAEQDFPVTAHPAAWQALAAVAGRALDGGALLLHLQATGALASDGLGLVDPVKAQIDALGSAFLGWARGLFLAPDSVTPGADMHTWDPRHLEYAVDVSAPHQDQPAVLTAPEYRGGTLDWFSFDAGAPTTADHGATRQPAQVTSFLPTAIQFDGMPNTRYWAFEEGATNFGDIAPDTTDLAKLLLIEFGLVYANDWFLLPLQVPTSSLTSIVGLTVTNVFGERFWIGPAVTNSPTQSWRMFALTPSGANDDRLFVPAVVPTGLTSAPVEAVALVRDEVANMVWGIETTVRLADGSSRRGREVAQELHARYQAAVTAPPPTTPANDAALRYTLMTSVGEHWIPFIPVHIDGDNRQIQLQRGAMPRLLDGQQGVTPAKITPRTALLREGLDAGLPYYLTQAEVERTGTLVETRWQRVRWHGGRVVTWLSNTRSTGRGEAASTLAFDTLTPKPAATSSS
jgi:hypothetical protein